MGADPVHAAPVHADLVQAGPWGAGSGGADPRREPPVSADPVSGGDTLGPTTARNWGWALAAALPAALLALSAAEATRAAGPGWRETGLPLLLALPLAAAAVRVWRAPPFERTALRVTGQGVEVAGRRATVRLAWQEIAAITHRPAALGPAHMTLERAAGGADGPPGVMFPVRATGARMEEVLAFLARGAARAGYRLEEPGRGAGLLVHRLPGPRRWVLVPVRA